MSRAIEIIDTSGFYWSVSIDGNVIHLGKRLCRVDFGNADNLNSVLKDIEDVFIWRHTFSDVQSRTNTFNLLILLDSIYYESTLELFQYHCAEIMKEYCRERMTEAVYDFYIKDLKVTGVTRYMTITLVVRSKFTLAVVSDRYGKMLEEAFEAVLGTAVHLQFETALEAEGKNERS